MPFVNFAVEASVHQSGYDLKELIPMIGIPELSLILWITMSKSTDPAIVEGPRTAYKKLKNSGKYLEIMQALTHSLAPVKLRQ